MRTTCALLLVIAIGALPAAAQTPPQGDVWRTVAQNMEVGGRIAIALRSGQRLTATLLEAGPDGLLLQPRTRVPVPAQRVAYEEIVSLERDTPGGIGPGKAVALGIASGVGAFFGTLLIFIAAHAD